MSREIDCVLTSHPDALTCGTGKFSQQLATRLGVPCDRLTRWHTYQHPLISIRFAELEASICGGPRWGGEQVRTYDLLAHDLDADHLTLWNWITGAKTAYGANPEVAEKMRLSRPDVQTLWCPSTMQGNPTRGAIDVLTFGMAHKVNGQHFEKLKEILDQTPSFGEVGNYTISLSTAIHEGKPWDEGFRESQEQMAGVFGTKLRSLGFLGDDGIARLGHEVNAICLFYPGGVRANNTSFWAALELGAPVITNLDGFSPPELVHNASVFDISRMDEWPDAATCRVVRGGAAEALDRYSWDRLVQTLKEPVAERANWWNCA